LGQTVGHEVVTPLQVTCPCSVLQLRFTAEQVVPVQLTEGSEPQSAVHVAFPTIGRFASSVGSGMASVARNFWSVALSTGADGDEPGSAIAGDIIRPRAARVSTNPRTNLFIAISFREI
jgi:hypothetical protein